MVFTANSTLEPAALSESQVQITENSQNFREIDALIDEKDVEEEITEPLFEVKNCCEARGQGMFAVDTIQAGQIILREKPLIVMPDQIFSLEDTDYAENWLDKKINKLSSEDRAKFYDLSDSRSENKDEKTTLGIFYTNDMNYIDDSAALFAVMARANHSCTPNADFITRPNLGVQDLVATKKIEKGEEILISYLPAYAEGSDVVEIRKEYTREWYGFQCTCRECCLKGHELDEKTKIRTKVSKLHSKGMDNLTSKECLELLENLIKIDSKLPHQLMVCKIGFEKALLEDDWAMAAQFYSAAYLNESILSCDEINKWAFVRHSIPVHIENVLYLFTED